MTRSSAPSQTGVPRVRLPPDEARAALQSTNNVQRSTGGRRIGHTRRPGGAAGGAATTEPNPTARVSRRGALGSGTGMRWWGSDGGGLGAVSSVRGGGRCCRRWPGRW